MPTPITAESLLRAPKVLLHDHLDGGLRPATVVDLARESGYADLPTTDPAGLGAWFRDAADSGSLERYLETFAHTVGVMQTLDRAAPGGRRVRRGPGRGRRGLRRGPVRPRAARRGRA